MEQWRSSGLSRVYKVKLTGHYVAGEHDDAALKARLGVVVRLDAVRAAIAVDYGARDGRLPRHTGRIRALRTPNIIDLPQYIKESLINNQ